MVETLPGRRRWNRVNRIEEGEGKEQVCLFDLDILLRTWTDYRSRGIDQDTDPLPKIAYNTVTQKRLREILEELDLPTTGDRSAMAARHSRYGKRFIDYILRDG